MAKNDQESTASETDAPTIESAPSASDATPDEIAAQPDVPSLVVGANDKLRSPFVLGEYAQIETAPADPRPATPDVPSADDAGATTPDPAPNLCPYCGRVLTVHPSDGTGHCAPCNRRYVLPTVYSPV